MGDYHMRMRPMTGLRLGGPGNVAVGCCEKEWELNRLLSVTIRGLPVSPPITFGATPQPGQYLRGDRTMSKSYARGTHLAPPLC